MDQDAEAAQRRHHDSIACSCGQVGGHRQALGPFGRARLVCGACSGFLRNLPGEKQTEPLPGTLASPVRCYGVEDLPLTSKLRDPPEDRVRRGRW